MVGASPYFRSLEIETYESLVGFGVWFVVLARKGLPWSSMQELMSAVHFTDLDRPSVRLQSSTHADRTT